ncbi:MAG: SoxR reducing system RseC family protein [Psychrosphaera sp.]|nr:SoxR reducing system RseC family protein [Psychrosphaera sp.]
MLEEKGKIISIEDDLVWVQTQIKTTCGSCKAKDNCGISAIAKAFSPKPNVISVHTDMTVKVGDNVVLGIDEGFVVLSSFYVYILPILGFMLFALLGEQMFESENLLGELINVVLAFFGGWLGYLLARRKLAKVACRNNDNVLLLSVDEDQIPITLIPK